MNLQVYLADLEERICAREETRLEQEWLDFADLKLSSGFFAPARQPKKPTADWQPILINDALADDELMIYQQLYYVSETLRSGTGEILSVRSNFGTGIIPTMLGAELFIMPKSTDTLPATRPLDQGKAAILQLAENNSPNFSQGLAGRAFAVAEKYLALVEKYPKVKRFIKYYNPDLQGPFSLCEAVWGSDIYLDLYLDPVAVKTALEYFTEIYINFTKKWLELCPPFDANHAVEWGCLHRGWTIIRNDAAMNISGELYQEFVQPHDQRILEEFGGGVHFCGRGDHYTEHLAAIKNLSCINISQPDWNDMERIYRQTVDQDIVIFGLPRQAVEQATRQNRPLRGRVHAGAALAAWQEADKD